MRYHRFAPRFLILVRRLGEGNLPATDEILFGQEGTYPVPCRVTGRGLDPVGVYPYPAPKSFDFPRVCGVEQGYGLDHP